jgi:precorrin-6A/cobalt-precorrin-6A reductase
MILFLAGTSDARALALRLQEKGYNLLASVVTDSAAASLQEAGIPYRVGRLNKEQMLKLLEDQSVSCIVDASHPFAEEASKTAMAATLCRNIPYIRYERPNVTFNHPLITKVDSYEEAAFAAKERMGTVMLTTGSKTLAVFTKHLLNENLRLLCRMLPNKENMEKCEALGLAQKDIIAIQGPFSKELNMALYKQYGVTQMVTKESGKVGSIDEKMEAALELGIDIILIKRPTIEYNNRCTTFEEVEQQLGGFF